MTPRPGESLTPTARLGIRALRSERPWHKARRCRCECFGCSHEWHCRRESTGCPWQGQVSRPAIRPLSRSRRPRPPDPLVSYDRALRWPTRILCVLVVLGMLFIGGSVAMRVL